MGYQLSARDITGNSAVTPQAVVRGRDGYLRVFYSKLGVPFETYDRWVASGARTPATAQSHD